MESEFLFKGKTIEQLDLAEAKDALRYMVNNDYIQTLSNNAHYAYEQTKELKESLQTLQAAHHKLLLAYTEALAINPLPATRRGDEA